MSNLITEIEVRSVVTSNTRYDSMPFGVSINPYRGCLFGCSYCLAPDTLIRYADLSEKPLGDVKTGDILLGFDETPEARRHRRYRHSTVEGVWWSKKPAVRITTEDAEIVTTAGHLWLTGTRKPVWTLTENLDTRYSLRYVWRLPATPADSLHFFSRPSRIVNIEPVGERDVVDIRTSSRTFIAGNLATHNCYASKFVYDDADKKAEWGHWVQVKKNAVDALMRESHKLTGASIFFSSATDPYQPIEKRLGLSRAMIEVILLAWPKHLHIQTRSPHVVRDIDLFQKFGDSITVGFSVPTDSDVVRKAFEPRAPSIGRRLKAAKELRDAGIRTIGSVAPLLPCTPKRLAKLFRPCFDSAWVGTMNFYEKGEALREIYESHGWNDYLLPAHKENVKAALQDAGLRAKDEGQI